MIINLLCKAFIAILDILLLDFYLKNIYHDIYTKNIKNTKIFVYGLLFIGFIILENLIIYTFFYLFLLIFIAFILHHFRIDYLSISKGLIILIIIRISVYVLLNIFFSWILDTRITLGYIDFSLPYTIYIYDMITS